MGRVWGGRKKREEKRSPVLVFRTLAGWEGKGKKKKPEFRLNHREERKVTLGLRGGGGGKRGAASESHLSSSSPLTEGGGEKGKRWWPTLRQEKKEKGKGKGGEGGALPSYLLPSSLILLHRMAKERKKGERGVVVPEKKKEEGKGGLLQLSSFSCERKKLVGAANPIRKKGKSLAYLPPLFFCAGKGGGGRKDRRRCLWRPEMERGKGKKGGRREKKRGKTATRFLYYPI